MTPVLEISQMLPVAARIVFVHQCFRDSRKGLSVIISDFLVLSPRDIGTFDRCVHNNAISLRYMLHG